MVDIVFVCFEELSETWDDGIHSMDIGATFFHTKQQHNMYVVHFSF